jgi:hypothetical protein
MAPRLEDLPVEMVEQIVTSLGYHDIAALRLTSRIIESKTSQGSFTAYFKHKNIELTMESLQTFERMTREDRMGRFLRHCTINGIARTEEAPAEDSSENSQFLFEAFRNLKQNCPHGCLVSLSLGVATRTESRNGGLTQPESFRSWTAIWATALQTFELTMAALDASLLPVSEELSIFGGLRGCSQEWNAFLSFARNFASTLVFRALRKLVVSLSASPRMRAMGDKDGVGFEEALETQPLNSVHQTSVLGGILELSRIMPSLETLDLRWYKVGHTDLSPSPYNAAQQSSNGTASLRLKECILRGLYESEEDLLQFLQTVQPAAVTLDYVHLLAGTYDSIFTYLTGADSPVKSYHLDDIWQSRILHFEVMGSPKYPYGRDNLGPSILTRQGNQVKDAIRYRLPRGRPLDSGKAMRWHNSKVHEFGPPDYGYDFIELNPPKVVPHTLSGC